MNTKGFLKRHCLEYKYLVQFSMKVCTQKITNTMFVMFVTEQTTTTICQTNNNGVAKLLKGTFYRPSPNKILVKF